MQVEVHDVDAEIARAHHAEDGVEVGAVVVDQAAGLVDDLDRPRSMCSSQRPSVFGLVIISAAVSGPTSVAQLLDVDVAARVRWHRDDLEAGHRGGRRVGAVRRVRDQDLSCAPCRRARVIRAGDRARRSIRPARRPPAAA